MPAQYIAHPDVKLWIAGEATGLLYQSVRKMAIELKVDDCVRWLGLRRDIPALLDAADAFVQASAWEGMPLAIGEAMAMEKPVVATDVGGVRELLGDAGGLVPAHDPQALADAMMAIMRKTQTDRQAMGTVARARIEREFNMDSCVVQWEELLLRKCWYWQHRPEAQTLTPAGFLTFGLWLLFRDHRFRNTEELSHSLIEFLSCCLPFVVFVLHLYHLGVIASA